ncbi:ABC transporter permease, partial [Streptococcus pyogenes]
ILVVIQTIPTIALAPILVLWLGYGILPKVVLIILTTTFPIIVNILDGFRNCDADGLRLFQLMGAKPWQVLWHFKIPNALPYFYAGLRVSVSYA